MFEQAGALFLYLQTPLHAGSGASVHGGVDLPIQREEATNLPMVQASGLKGVLRELARRAGNRQLVDTLFGPESGNEAGSALAFTDVRLLLFPVASLQGLFWWVTCPLVLERLKRDLVHLTRLNGGAADTNLEQVVNLAVPRPDQKQVAVPSSGASLLYGGRLLLREQLFQQLESDEIDQWAGWLAANIFPGSTSSYWRESLRERLAVVDNDTFAAFTQEGVEVFTRVKIGDQGTVDAGPWQEENLPAESVLYSIAFAQDARREERNSQGESSRRNGASVMQALSGEVIGQEDDNTASTVVQLGGDETVGRGLVQLHLRRSGGFSTATQQGGTP